METIIAESGDSAISADDPPLPKRIRQHFQVTEKEWHNWKWQLQNRIRSIDDLISILPDLKIKESEKAIRVFPMAITPYYLSLIRSFDFSDPVFRMSVPHPDELHNPVFMSNDPLQEEEHTVVPRLVHRYPDRALLISTSICGMYCRYCTRKRIAGCTEKHISREELSVIVNYLEEHKEIHDVIISGGDPLTMPTKKLEEIISAIRKIKHIDIIRIGTKTIVTLPMRIDSSLVKMLKKYHPIYVNTHFNHPNEIKKESKQACEKLVDAGIPIGNQSVLLKGVNDNTEIMMELCRNLLKIRCKPYYLFQCDLVKGCEHFRTKLETGMNIVGAMRGKISGLGIPSFILDAPNGIGKVPLLPNNFMQKNEKETILYNFCGEKIIYPEPF